MKLATGISSLFIAAAAAIHSALILFGSTLTGDDTSMRVGYIFAGMAVLFLIGGSLSFKEIRIAHALFMIAAILGAVTTILESTTALIWAIPAFILAFTSDHVEPHTIPAS